MAEYIEREVLLSDICDDMCGLKYTGVCENCRVVALIADAPAADVAPVVHGRWIDGLECSICGADRPTDGPRDAIWGEDCKFCYSCGAKMDGEP